MLKNKIDTLDKKKFIALFTLLIFCQSVANIFASGEARYESLRSSWYEIFPDFWLNPGNASYSPIRAITGPVTFVTDSPITAVGMPQKFLVTLKPSFFKIFVCSETD